jgi:hypothetical protein
VIREYVVRVHNVLATGLRLGSSGVIGDGDPASIVTVGSFRLVSLPQLLAMAMDTLGAKMKVLTSTLRGLSVEVARAW